MENWKPCPGYPKYAVSDLGRVKRIAWVRSNGVMAPEKILKGSPSKSVGYPQVGLYKGDNSLSTKNVHYLVCETFHGPRPTPAHTVAHRDGTRTNNKAKNLRWATQSEQREDQRKHGTLMEGEKHPLARLTETDVRYIREVYMPRHKKFGSRPLGRKFGVSHKLIISVVQRSAWKHVV